MEPSKNPFFVPKMIYFPKRTKDQKMGTSWVPYNLLTLKEPKTPGTTWNHLKMHFCYKNDLFYQTGSKSENGNQLDSMKHVNINEPKTPGTAWTHLIFFCSKNDLFSQVD